MGGEGQEAGTWTVPEKKKKNAGMPAPSSSDSRGPHPAPTCLWGSEGEEVCWGCSVGPLQGGGEMVAWGSWIVCSLEPPHAPDRTQEFR